jgi:uncharacterized protein (TIGR02328 family)
MRLWHQSLIKQLDRQRLLGQHRECCALRGGGWGKPHATVNYVFDHDPSYLVAYHLKIIEEMKSRGYKVDPQWENIQYRGKSLLATSHFVNTDLITELLLKDENIFPEHNDDYLKECLENLSGKGVHIEALF